MTDEKLRSMIAPYRIIGKVLSRFFAVIGICTLIYMIITPDGLITFLFLLLCFILFAVISGAVHNKIEKILTDDFIGVAIKEAFGDSVEFDPNGKVLPGPMEFSFPYNKAYGEGQIKTVYKGLKIQLSDMTLKNERTSTEGDVNAFTSFRGQLLIFDLGKELSGEVFISAYSRMNKPGFERDVMMDNEEFDERFYVKTKVPEEAFRILTPHMMKYILKMADKINGKLYIAFLRSGKIYIAVNTNRSLFKVDYNPKVDYDMMMKNFLDDMKWFTDMIDKLRAENTIYKKEMSI